MDAQQKTELPGISGGRYEVMFSIFLFIAVVFLKSNPLVSYPQILYPMFFLMFLNFFLNRYFRERERVGIWFVDIVAFSNSLAVALLVSLSGGADSVLWVMFLLPLFNAAVSGRPFHFYLVFSFAALCLAYPYAGIIREDIFNSSTLIVKAVVLYAGGAAVLRSVISRRELEKEIASKRQQIGKLLDYINKSETISASDPEEDKVTFMATSVHDIKNIMTVINLTAQILEKEEGGRKEDFKRLSSASKMATNLANYTLSVAKSKGMEMAGEDLVQIIGGVLDLMEYKFKSRKITVEKDFKVSAAPVKASRMHLERVFVNLLSNSISVLPPEGKITVSVSSSDGKAKAVFSDNGPGFPKEILDKIEPFKTMRGKAGGTGLGLSSSVEIVGKHGGSFSIRNAETGGSEAEIILPLA